ncbi:MAG TPA: DUF1707 and DUF4190 domain-containing protein [Streptosporangiaceae bacterium]|nr:DUF1707 and DUF4190 domain-containing protein [Streptosporangiaceae bacterium]
MTFPQDSRPSSGGRAQTRASTTDRDRAVELLKKAYTDGRLGKDEYDARLEGALSAVTYADLDSVVADLPVPHHPMSGVPMAPPVPMAPAVPRTNSLATASFVLGLVGIVFGVLASIPAIVLGYIARRQIRRTGERGAGLALAGLILGWVWVGLLVLALVLLVAIGANSTATGGIRG